MRKQYIQTNNRKKALKIAPWAGWLVKMTEGFMAFESYDDMKTFVSQK